MLYCGEAESPYSWENVPYRIPLHDLSGAAITRYVGEPKDDHPDVFDTEVATCNNVWRGWFFKRPKNEYCDLMGGIIRAPLAL